MGHVLSVDSALGACNVAVLKGDQVFSRSVATQREQAQIFVPLVQEVLGEANLGFKDLDLLVSTKGPGSFTGLRIGLSTARAWAVSLGIRAVGVTTLEATAHQYLPKVEGDRDILVVLESKRSDFYAQLFDSSGVPKTEPMADEVSVIVRNISEPICVVGDAVQRFQESVGGKNFVYMHDKAFCLDPVCLAQLGAKKCDAGAMDDLEPVYLRQADVSVSKKAPTVLEES